MKLFARLRRTVARFVYPEAGIEVRPQAVCETRSEQVEPVMVRIERNSNDTHTYLIDLGSAYASHTNLSHWRVSFLMRGDGQFLRRLGEGKSCTLKTATIAMQWFSDYWPADLEWPRHIPRPSKSKKEAA